jgi:predicted phage-related endonuclease
MNALARTSLTAEQQARRKGKLTASRIACLMRGDPKPIMQLWLELTGQAEPEDLSGIWPVQLGAATEQLNLDWFARKSGAAVSRRGEVVNHPMHVWAAATLDGWTELHDCPIETKHVGGREPLEVVLERYQPQLQWQMECTGAAQCAISIIMGVSEPIVEFIDRDIEYAREMVARGAQFMAHVANRTEPVILGAVPSPIVADKTYDMTGNNSWANHAISWRETREAAEHNKIAEKTLKSLVPDDAKKCHGHQVQITRDRAGRLSLREQQ